MVYEIFEVNMDRLEKKLKRIEAKCSKYGCEFHYQKIGEAYETVHGLNGELVTGEFKQVGRSCLKDFTGGLDASAVAQYISFFDELIGGKGLNVENVHGLVGTVKNRSEYNGWKQTELTRCKVS